VRLARRILPSRCAAALPACFGLCISASAAAADTTSDSAAMDAPGRSNVPAPTFEHPSQYRRRDDYSSQDMALELRFGPYAPRVDDSNGLTHPVYKSFFGDKTRFQFGLEVDWQLWRAPHIGTLGVGGGWAFTRLSGSNKLPDDATSVTPIQQETSFTIMPMYGVGVLRVDVLSHDYGIPLVGYGKFGPAYALWWMNNGNGTPQINCDTDGKHCTSGKDHSWGTQAALGLMLQIDWLEPSAGVELDTSLGINNSYIFIEWSVSNYGGQQMNVGANTWVTGFAFEM
jgi:hypothetical protein